MYMWRFRPNWRQWSSPWLPLLSRRPWKIFLDMASHSVEINASHGVPAACVRQTYLLQFGGNRSPSQSWARRWAWSGVPILCTNEPGCHRQTCTNAALQLADKIMNIVYFRDGLAYHITNYWKVGKRNSEPVYGLWDISIDNFIWKWQHRFDGYGFFLTVCWTLDLVTWLNGMKCRRTYSTDVCRRCGHQLDSLDDHVICCNVDGSKIYPLSCIASMLRAILRNPGANALDREILGPSRTRKKTTVTCIRERSRFFRKQII